MNTSTLSFVFTCPIKNAIEESIEGNVNERKKEDAIKKEQAVEIVKKHEQAKKESNNLEELKKQIVSYITENKGDTSKTAPLVKYLKNEGIGNPLNIADVETAKKVIDFIESSES